MAKIRIPNQRKANLEHKKRVERYAALIQQLYDKVANEAARYADLSGVRSDAAFSFDDYPMARAAVNRLLKELMSDVQAVIMAGTSEEWKQSNLVQDLVARKVLTAYTGNNRFGEEFTRYFQTNPESLKAFQERKDEGMNLSTRVWNLSEQYKAELEEAITAAIAPGTSAVELAAGVKKYLKEPDKRFRRIKEKMEDGTIKWHLSNPAKAYHPGRGVYRSSARNAQRLARTEINMAYRTAEQKRWEQFDFVVGYEVKTTQNGHHVEDICDRLAGKYPKDFKFRGWHPSCLCYCIPILKTEDEFWSLDDGKPSVNEVRDVPANFKEWVGENTDRIEKASERGTLPYFIRDNKEVVEKAMSGEPTMKAVPMASNVTEAERTARALVEDNRRRVEEATGYPCGEPMDFDQANEMRGNPNYKKGVKFRVNCQSSVLANEMRRRGFDVEAYGNTKQDWFMPSVLAKKPEIAFMDANGELPVPKPIRFNRDLLSSLDGEMKEMGRYHLRFRFANDGGHIITAERLPDGSLRIYDPQSGKTIKDFSEYATKVKQDSFEYYRVDNLQINPEVAKGAVKIAKSKGDAPRMQLPEIKEFLEKGWYGEIKADVAEYVKLRNAASTNREKVALDMDIIRNGGFIRSPYHSTPKGSIYATEELPKKISKDDLELSKNIQMARKMANNGYDCYLLSNPHGTKSADFIFVKDGKVYYTEGKLSTGKNSLDHNLSKGKTQAERVLIDLTGTNDTRYITSQLSKAFDENDNLKEVKLLKGGREISVTRQDVRNNNFVQKFKQQWEQRK